ncbi:ACP-like domain-containing protein [Ursidibacter sp. B-7004-1]
MKLVKFVPAIAATLVLAACSTPKEESTAPKAMPQATETVMNTPVGEVTKVEETLMTQNKSVVYSCQKGGTVTATYAFHNSEVKGANVRVGKKNEITGFVVDAEDSKKTEETVFTSGDYVWAVENGLTFDSAEKTNAIMLYKKGKMADEILAKNCKINKSATARLNK